MNEFRNNERVLSTLQDTILQKKVCAVYGDYDVDGLMSLMIWKETLNLLEYRDFFFYTRTTVELMK